MPTYRIDKSFPTISTLWDIDTGESWTLWGEDMATGGRGVVRHTLKLAGIVVMDETKQKNDNPAMLVSSTDIAKVVMQK